MRSFLTWIALAILAAGCSSGAAGAGSPTADETAVPTPAPTATATSATATPAPTADVIHVSVTFDGTDCIYSGPLVFPKGAAVMWAFANVGPAAIDETIQGAMLVGAVEAGTTWEMAKEAEKTPASRWPPAMADLAHGYGFVWPPSGTMGREMQGDEYYVGCLTPPESSDRAYSAALIYVVDV
jgi:hypothetical protein